MIQYSLKPLNKNDKTSMKETGFIVFDQDLNKIWQQEQTLPESEKRLDIKSSCIDKNNQVHFLVKRFHDDSRKDGLKDGTINHHWEVFTINGESSKIERSKISLQDDLLFKDLKIFEGADDDIIITGYYAKSQKDAAAGAFLFYLSNAGEEIDAIITPFEQEEFKKFVAESKKDKKDKSKEPEEPTVRNLVVRNVEILEDGSITTAGEIYYFVTGIDVKGNPYTNFLSEDIYAINISKEGDVNWFRKIPKRQISGGTYGLGYQLIIKGTDHYFIFVDNLNNIDIKTDQSVSACSPYRADILNSYLVTKDGNLEQHVVLNTKEFGDYKLYQFDPSRITQLNDGFGVEVYIKQKKDIMIRVNINK